MDTIKINTRTLNTGKHKYLKQQFNFPDYYGENLDALYDCLGDLEETKIIVHHIEEANEFSIRTILVFNDIANKYKNLILEFSQDEQNTSDNF